MSARIVATEKAPAAIGPYSQGVVCQNMLYTAGQIPLDPQTGKVVEGDVRVQTRQVLENLKAVLEAAGTDFNRVIRATVYLTDMKNFPALNEVYGDYLGEVKPARVTVAVAQLPLSVDVEIEMIAQLP